MFTKLKELLIEDEKILQKIHMFQLEKLGCEVDVAEDGQQALLLVAQHEYDLIFMDVGLSDMTGIQVTKIIRRKEKNVPIVVLTAYVDEEVKNQCLIAGADEVFYKPIPKERFMAIVTYYGERKKFV